jgi:UDP-N-acetylmuramate--alanine ligase
VLDQNLPMPPAWIHMIGIGGVGISGLARMLASRGYHVTGSDMSLSPVVEALRLEGVSVIIGHDAGNIGDADLVIATAAARDENPEIAAARQRNIPIVKRAAALGMLANPAECLAVAGSHGKSTTSGMAAFALTMAGFAPSFAVGATVSGLSTNAKLGDGPHFVVEADEYDHSFLWLQPAVAIITNIEHDHPDIFDSLQDVLAAFERFASGIRDDGTLVVAADDPGAQMLVDRLAGLDHPRVVTFGWGSGDWQVVAYTGSIATVRGPEDQMFELRLSVPGRHNISNALSVIAATDALGIDPVNVIPHLNAFSGVGRRFDILLDSPARTVIDDYAHHPTEISATISAARERYPGRRLLVVFQPHTYSRTHALLGEFAAALDAADEAIVASIYAAREVNTLGVSSGDIVSLMATYACVVDSPADATRAATERFQPGDVVLVMGAGDIFLTSQALAEGEMSI